MINQQICEYNWYNAKIGKLIIIDLFIPKNTSLLSSEIVIPLLRLFYVQELNRWVEMKNMKLQSNN